MSTFKIQKVVTQLPQTTEANTVYLVRVRDGFDIYVTDSTNQLTFMSNPSLTWIYLITSTSKAPEEVGVATVETKTGKVFKYTFGTSITYRFVPTTYSFTLDAFYEIYENGNLSNLIVKRGK